MKRITVSHHIYQNSGTNQIISVPVHRNQDLKIGTLKSLMKVAELTEEDLE
ncbi:type II toxin-antitoxin system HicA family toxin [Oscillatoria salina]|uniref:type II toxin-antitoxin system HicA family toxin n=1 Tax=Oscillatoria salina TaxID=331517 RepID=UPI001CCD9251|nr:type II toxin-antitoxin system HicA family toxin [Oscillatoria salina]